MRVKDVVYSSVVPKLRSVKQKNERKNYIPQIPEPVKKGINTGIVWFSFGIALDYISRRFQIFKNPTKNSLFLNGIIGLGAGLYVTYKELHESEKNNKR